MKNKWKQFEDWFDGNFGWFLSPAYKLGKKRKNSIYK